MGKDGEKGPRIKGRKKGQGLRVGKRGKVGKRARVKDGRRGNG